MISILIPEVISAEDIWGADSGDTKVEITDTDATATAPGWERDTWEEVPAGWGAAIMAMGGASTGAMPGIEGISGLEPDASLAPAITATTRAEGTAGDPAVSDWADGTAESGHRLLKPDRAKSYRPIQQYPIQS